jgi:hypothetical protein
MADVIDTIEDRYVALVENAASELDEPNEV